MVAPGRAVWDVGATHAGPSNDGCQGRGRGRGRGAGLQVPPVSPTLSHHSHLTHADAPGSFAPSNTIEGNTSQCMTADEEERSLTDVGEVALKGLDEVFGAYLSESGGGECFVEGVSRVRQFLNSSICLVCLEPVPGDAAIWSCQAGCHTAFHLICIQSWAKQEADRNAYRKSMQLDATRFPDAAKAAEAEAQWHCPKCRAAYGRADTPSDYLCFCKKTLQPAFDPWLSPHTCGERCDKPLANCEHTCKLLCHPGPCPPCPRIVDATCFCGATTAPRRCGTKSLACAKICSKKLDCGEHRCTLTCHEGPCPPCERTAVGTCRCGKTRKTLPCAVKEFGCDELCGKPLSCGHHVCQRECHKGPCGPCALSSRRTCNCGKLTLTGLSCEEPTPSCGNTCEKLLVCGVHLCAERCHEGECNFVCTQLVPKTCGCGSLTKTVPCSQKLRCERKCQRMRECGRHACKRRCCDGNCAPCGEVCGRKLMCGTHKCTAPCHDGPCLPCPRTVLVSCACGFSRAEFPCGRDRSSKQLPCPRPCTLGVGCRHKGKFPHRCHYGPCPPCPSEACGSTLECGHPCPLPCHDPPPPPLPSYEEWTQTMRKERQRQEQKAQSAAANANGGVPLQQLSLNSLLLPRQPITALATLQPDGVAPFYPGHTACHPCVMPVTQPCVGGHTVRQLACHVSRSPGFDSFSCEEHCRQLLECGRHTCDLQCHALPPSDNAVPCAACTRTCALELPCGHKCDKTCHPGECDPCERSNKWKCHGDHQILIIKCKDRLGKSEEELAWMRACGLPCGRSLPRCPHECVAKCHAGDCPAPEKCKKKVTVRCSCRRMKRQWECSKVQEALANGRPKERAAYSAATMASSISTPTVLECDEDCRAHQQKAQQSKSTLVQKRDSNIEIKEPAKAAAQAPQPELPVDSGSRNRKSPKKNQVKAASVPWWKLDAKTQEVVCNIIGILIVCLVGIFIGVYVNNLMTNLDQSARNRWQPDL